MKKLILATSEFCGPCKVIKKFIAENSLNVELKEMENDLEFFKEKKIKAVPTLIVDDQKISGVENIIDFLQSSAILKE
jgi:glutaredoxin